LDGADQVVVPRLRQIDNLTDHEVIWQPFTDALVIVCAPQGLSFLCFRDCDFWMTKTPLIHDMYIEEYHVERVLRQFGLYQASPVPVTHTVDLSVHP
jgi:hypothetical protein